MEAPANRAARLTSFVADPDFSLYCGDALEVLQELPDTSIDCCVTSPPYWGLRDYQMPEQLGHEATPDDYVARLVAVFTEVRRALVDHGTLWLNLGDSYNNRSTARRSSHQGGLGFESEDLSKTWARMTKEGRTRLSITNGDLKEKDLVGIPWMVAFALRREGWYLRRDIVWNKVNPMPESIKDRPTSSHEYVFLLSKSARYHYDASAIAEPAKWIGPNGMPQKGPHAGQMRERVGKNPKQDRIHENQLASGDRTTGFNGRCPASVEAGTAPLTRNARSVWDIQTQPYADAHFAVFPEELPRRCILAGCPGGGTVLDPFLGSGTTALVARKHGRRAVGIELNPDYCEMAARRLQQLSLLA